MGYKDYKLLLIRYVNNMYIEYKLFTMRLEYSCMRKFSGGQKVWQKLMKFCIFFV